MSNTMVQPVVGGQRPGFRFSAFDGVVIGVVAVGTAVLWPVIEEMALLLPVVLFHFFLFCNMFRVRRESELVWAGVFVVNVGAWCLAGEMSWGRVLLVQSPLTVGLLAAEVFSPRYHGVGYARVNRRARLGLRQEVQP